MTCAELIEKVKKITNGHMVRVTYKSDVGTYKNSPVTITKITESTMRLGVNYNNIQSIIDKKASGVMHDSTQDFSHISWIVPNKIKHNAKKNTDYLRLAYVPHGSNSRVHYIVNGVEMDQIPPEDFMYVKASNSTAPRMASEIKDIKVDNIISLVSCELA